MFCWSLTPLVVGAVERPHLSSCSAYNHLNFCGNRSELFCLLASRDDADSGSNWKKNECGFVVVVVIGQSVMAMWLVGLKLDSIKVYFERSKNSRADSVGGYLCSQGKKMVLTTLFLAMASTPASFAWNIPGGYHCYVCLCFFIHCFGQAGLVARLENFDFGTPFFIKKYQNSTFLDQ